MDEEAAAGQRDGAEEDVLERLESDAQRGLSPDEAARRLERYGRNALAEEKAHPLLKLLGQFWGPIPWMLEAALVLSAVAQRWEEFGVILLMLLINGGVSFWHESKAESAIDALKEQLAQRARVIRGGERSSIDAAELVPGDLVELRVGDVVPADIELVSDGSLGLDESALTGESLPVDKEKGATAYSGTSVKRGETRGVVVATGADTEFARTVELVETAEERSHFRQAVVRIGYFLISASLVLVAIILAVGLWRGDPWMELVMFALVLIIAGIPQALPAVLTVTMTVGAHRLAARKAIVSRLAAMDEIAGLETLCADKTGTLTRNQLELQEPVLLDCDDPEELVTAAALTARPDEAEDPIDRAILDALKDRSVLDAWTVEAFEPFDPDRKRAEATVTSGERRMTVAKGAPQRILDLVDPDDARRREITEKVEELGRQGYRALGVARREDGGDWRYLGLLPLLDPPHEGVDTVVGQARRRGIDVRMVTGDHKAIARQVAGQVGLDDDIASADELFGERRGGEEVELDSDAQRRVGEAAGFAQVSPEDKFTLVRHFQAGDRIVGMTGDGVNDAPALQQADVGIAVADATDAARSASDLVLTEQGLGVIIEAVEEARRIFQRMTSYAIFRIAESTRMVLFIAISILAFEFYPVTPVMIILLAILNDIPIMTMAWDNTPTPTRPVRWEMRRVLGLAAFLGLWGVASSFLLFWYVRGPMGLPDEQVQTLIFLKLLVAGHMTIFLTRSERWMWTRPFPHWALFVTLEGTQVAGTLFAIFGVLVAPVPWQLALAIWGYSIVSILVLNVFKVLLTRTALWDSVRGPAGRASAPAGG